MLLRYENRAERYVTFEQFAGCSNTMTLVTSDEVMFTCNVPSAATTRQPDCKTRGATVTFRILISRTPPDGTVTFPVMDAGAAMESTGMSIEPFTCVTPEAEQEVIGTPGIDPHAMGEVVAGAVEGEGTAEQFQLISVRFRLPREMEDQPRVYISSARTRARAKKQEKEQKKEKEGEQEEQADQEKQQEKEQEEQKRKKGRGRRENEEEQEK